MTIKYTPPPPPHSHPSTTTITPFGHQMRTTHFSFSPSFTPLNHGSFGTHPKAVTERQRYIQDLALERPDPFIVFDLPGLIRESRAVVAPLLGVDVDEVVLIPNATTGVNTVLRNLRFESGDTAVVFSTVYDSCAKTLASVKELQPGLEVELIDLVYPIEDEEIVRLLRERIEQVNARDGKRVKVAMFDIVSTFPGVRVPWENLVGVCKETGVLSLIDGAHGIGMIDLRHMGSVGVDFLVSNCHKWLYTPRGCAVFYVPFKNQHLIRTSLPTSHGYQYPHPSPSPLPRLNTGSSDATSTSTDPNTSTLTPNTLFTSLFEFTATIDYSPYTCIPTALSFRQNFCGGEEAIRDYCFNLARTGGQRVAEILETRVLDYPPSSTTNSSGRMLETSFTNIELPIPFVPSRNFPNDSTRQGGNRVFVQSEGEKIGQWVQKTALREFDTYLQIAMHGGKMWVRLSAQIYLEMGDFEWVGERLRGLCERIRGGEVGGE